MSTEAKGPGGGEAGGSSTHRWVCVWGQCIWAETEVRWTWRGASSYPEPSTGKRPGERDSQRFPEAGLRPGVCWVPLPAARTLGSGGVGQRAARVPGCRPNHQGGQGKPGRALPTHTFCVLQPLLLSLAGAVGAGGQRAPPSVPAVPWGSPPGPHCVRVTLPLPVGCPCPQHMFSECPLCEAPGWGTQGQCVDQPWRESCTGAVGSEHSWLPQRRGVPSATSV